MSKIRIALALLFISELAFSQVVFDNRVVVDQTGLANQVESVYTADLDGDGDLDLISASRADNKIAWYDNLDGNGNYGPQIVLSTDAENAVTVYAGDIDGDGDMPIQIFNPRYLVVKERAGQNIQVIVPVHVYGIERIDAKDGVRILADNDFFT
ncbi:MAG: FG-GAP-like repeat-containing protein, partial [Bacteroidota bacterium]